MVFDQAFHNGDVNASPPAATSPGRRGAIFARRRAGWSLRRLLEKQPPRCPEGGKSPARLAYLRQTAHVQLEAPSSPKDGNPRFHYSGHALAGFGSEAGGSLDGNGPVLRIGSTPLPLGRCRLQLGEPSGQGFHGLGQVVIPCVSITADFPNFCLQFRCVFRQLVHLHKRCRFPQTELSVDLFRCHATNETRNQNVLRLSGPTSQLGHFLGEFSDRLVLSFLQPLNRTASCISDSPWP
ncbi:hypothetical protein T03_2020 [Trichinella britovi]|uniref:Uncharacterized protein n=1 Tax=Trichinella britovi TaxID=45882 RepID=A0A0V1D953_TRIBR|nr:hypothetical protein T03_2020 [Trichinella britovi]